MLSLACKNFATTRRIRLGQVDTSGLDATMICDDMRYLLAGTQFNTLGH